MTNSLQFDAATHTYTLGGRVLPSVTHILESALREMDGIPSQLIEAAGDFGDHVHKACAFVDNNALDDDSLDVRLKPYVAGYRKFKRESGVIVAMGECRVYHEKLGYAGELDRLVKFRARPRLAVLDIKSATIMARSVGAQTAAYREAALTTLCGKLDTLRYSLHLRPDGTYRLDRLSDPSDFILFQSCLNIWRYKNART